MFQSEHLSLYTLQKNIEAWPWPWPGVHLGSAPEGRKDPSYDKYILTIMTNTFWQLWQIPFDNYEKYLAYQGLWTPLWAPQVWSVPHKSSPQKKKEEKTYDV